MKKENLIRQLNINPTNGTLRAASLILKNTRTFLKLSEIK